MVVPSHVHVIGLSSFPILVEAFPRYRGDSFFVVRDDIVIRERSVVARLRTYWVL